MPLVSSSTALPVTFQHIPHLSMDNVYRIPPHRTPPMLLQRSQIAGTGIHRPLEQQIPIHVNIPPVQCVVNNQQYIQNNISIHASNSVKSTTGSLFSPQDPLETGVQGKQQTLHKNNPVMTQVSIPSNIYTPRTLDSLGGMSFMQMGARKQFSGPPYRQFAKVMNGPIGNDDSSLPSHVYSSSQLRDTSVLVSTVASVPTHTINRRCLSESDAHDKMNGSQEHLQNILNPKTVPITYTTQVITIDQKTDNTPKYQYLPTGYSNQVYLSKFHTTNHSFQNLSNNSTVNISENNLPSQVIYAYDTQQQQQKKSMHSQQQMPPTSRIITNSALIPNLLAQPIIPISTREDKPAIVVNQQQQQPQQPAMSPMKTIPTGMNGTFLPSHVFDLAGI